MVNNDNKGIKAGVIGWPVEHSLSPRLHGFWLKEYGIQGSYERLAVPPEKLGETLRSLKEMGFRGVNLTIPHKEAALAFMDKLDPSARRIGAVNMVLVGHDGKLYGRNTDAYGFAQNLIAAGFKPGGTGTVVGAGGATRAVIVVLQDMGFGEIRLVNRTREKAEAMAKQFGGNIRVYDWDNRADAVRNATLLVNTSSLGMQGQPPLDIPLEGLSERATVTDIVYAPLMTDLLQRAQQKGFKTVDGLGMLLYQAVPAFAEFFGKDPEVTDELRRFVLGDKA